MAGRHKLDSDDLIVINRTKDVLTKAIDQLLNEHGVRDVNIQIELVEHIKNCLKK
jgi:short-subunit dehydrogenase